MDRGAWWAAVSGVTKSRTRQKDYAQHSATLRVTDYPETVQCELSKKKEWSKSGSPCPII